MPESPAVKTVAIQNPGAAFGVTGGCVLSVVVPGDTAGGVSAVSFEDTGSTVVVVRGTVAVTAGVAVLPEVGVVAGVPDEEEDEPCEPEEDVAVAVGATVSNETMFPLLTTSKLFATNCVSLHWGFWMVTVPSPDPTRVNRMTAREADSAAEIPSVLVTATFAYPASLSILGITSDPGISLLAVMLSIRTCLCRRTVQTTHQSPL
jgi:hypothetical protein